MVKILESALALPLAVKLPLALAAAMAAAAGLGRAFADDPRVLALAAALGALLAGFVFARLHARRVRALEAAVRAAAMGHEASAVEIGPQDELGCLAAAWAGAREAVAVAEEDLLRRLAELGERNAVLARAAEEAADLARVASDLGRELDPAKVVGRFTKWMRELFATDTVGVFLVSRDARELVASEGDAPVPTIALDDRRSSAARAFRERRSIPVASDDAARGASGRLARAGRAEACFAVPILSVDRAFGVLVIGFASGPYVGSKEAPRVVESIAAEAGVAIERARLAAALADRERDLRELFERAGDLIFAYAPTGRFTRANKATLAALGYTLEELLALSFSDVVVADASAPEEKAASDDRTASIELTLVAKNGRRLPLELRTRGVTREGRIVEMQVFGRDLAARQELERRRLEGARLKTAIELAGAAAHNLNQPLAGIMGFVDLLLATPLGADERDMLEKMRTQAVRMAETVKRMSGLTHLETEKYIGGDRIVKL